jgi:hypothetical protein
VKVLDDDKDENGTPYIVMELLRGDSVEGRAQKSGGRLSITETLDVLDQTLAVLEAAHAQSIIHRDLKPENLFMTEQGQLKVLDFGIARLREEKQSRRTQTGMVMGTPSFMAPEQAMGRWDEVDARTDLWAMGATAFTLLTGLPVHEAETAGEMLVAAATRPARSLARVLNGAPFTLVALVDRALAYERDNRFPDAHTFRKEIEKVRAAIQGELPAEPQLNAQKPFMPATVHGNEVPIPLRDASDDEDDDEKERIETYDPSSNSEEEVARLAKFFGLLERAMTAIKQYSREHPEPKRRFDEAFRELASALMTCDIALAWNLTPYSFTARDLPIWEPEAPLNRVPYQLFADGVRMMGFAPGLDQREFQEWVRLITLDPTTDFAPEDDLVTLLWDANLEHVFFQAIDSFAEGNQDQRARYEADRANVVAGAHVDHRAGLDDVVNERTPPGKKANADKASAIEKSRELFRLMSRGDSSDAEANARVANLNVLEESSDEADAAKSLQLDENTRALLSARMELDVGATSERFVVVAAEAFVASAKLGRSAAVSAPLRRAIDGLSIGAPHKAIEMILELREAVLVDGKELETESLRETMTSEVLSPGTLLDILRGSAKLDGDTKAEYLKGVARVLACLQPQHFESALTFLPEVPISELQTLLLAFIARHGRGHEMKIATLFPNADVDLGLALVRLLAEVDTETAKEAVALASQSPHALVRIEALGHIEGVSGPRLRSELRKLLEDPDPSVRLLALNAMEAHNITIAGPFLVLRIQDAEFFKLSFEERNQALKTLSRLRPKRCEEVCTALLADARLLRVGAREETRELAAQFLAEVAASDAAFFMLEGIAKSSGWRNSKRVRDAASAALVRLKERADAAEQRKAERSKVGPGMKSEAKKRRSGTGTAPDANAAAGSGTGSGTASIMPPAGKTGANSMAAPARATGAKPAPGGTTGAKPATANTTGAKPASTTGAKPASTTGAKPAPANTKPTAANTTGAKPAPASGAKPASAPAREPAPPRAANAAPANSNAKSATTPKAGAATGAGAAHATKPGASTERAEGEPVPNKEARSQT